MITSTSEKGRVAVMCCGHKEYWPQFPGMREEVINYMNEIAGYVQSSQAELLESRFVDNIDDSIAYGRDLKAKGCDLLILYVPAYIASGRYMQGVIAAECPVVVVGMQKAYKMSGEITIQKVTTDGGPCAIPEAYSAMVRSGLKPAGLVFGKACGDPHIINEIHEWCRVAKGLVQIQSVAVNIMTSSYEAKNSPRFINFKKEREIGKKWIKELAIKANGPETITGTLSGGNQQKVILAKWLELKPNVIILNEPTRGIDVGSKAEIYKLLNKMCKEGISVIMITSEMPELLAMANRVLVMHEGRLQTTLNEEQMTENNVMIAAIGGNIHEEQNA